MAVQNRRLSLACHEPCVAATTGDLQVNTTDVDPDHVGYTLQPESVRPVASHSEAGHVTCDVIMITLHTFIAGSMLSSC